MPECYRKSTSATVFGAQFPVRYKFCREHLMMCGLIFLPRLEIISKDCPRCLAAWGSKNIGSEKVYAFELGCRSQLVS